MITRTIALIMFIGFFCSSCGWNLNAPDNGNDPDPDSTAIFKVASNDNLPTGLSGTTPKARAADIDDDGDVDLILALEFEANKMLLNDGTGSFTDASSERLPTQNNDSRDVMVADLNNDGNFDLFFVGNQNQTNELYINQGNASFSDLSNRIPVTANTNSVAAFDADGDGPIDLLMGNIGQNALLMNNGNAFFNNQTIQRLPQLSDVTQDLAVGDITGDNLRDIVIANEDPNRLWVNTGSGFYADQTANRITFVNAIEETRSVALVDVDGDGDRDIYFGNTGFREGSNPQDRLLINNGAGFFADRTADQLPAITTNTFDAEFADLDQDGDFDLVVGNYNGGIRVLLNNGNGLFSDQSNAWIPENFTPLVMDLEIADFNSDGLPDLYIGSRDGDDQLLLQRKQ